MTSPFLAGLKAGFTAYGLGFSLGAHLAGALFGLGFIVAWALISAVVDRS